MKSTLDEMQTFVAVVDCGSITAAANQLNQTLSATSRTLGRLEAKLNTTLLNRTTRRIELTEEGRAYLEKVRAILELVEDSEELLQARHQQPAGRLRIDAASPFMLHVITPLVEGYQARYPLIELELNTNEGIIDLLERRTDLAIRIGDLKDSTLHATPLGRSRLRLLASPDYLARHGSPQNSDELLDHALLGFTQPESLNHWPVLDASGQAVHIQAKLRASNGETLRQLALQGCGIVCLSDFMTRADRAEGKLVEVLAEELVDVYKPINAVYYRNTGISSRIRSFIDYLQAQSGGFE